VTEELQRLEGKEDGILKEAEERLAKETTDDYTLDRSGVSRSISALTDKLTTQSRISAESDAVRQAETAMVRCLRLNDRRPLDCWKEVEDFKAEVARLEKSFVGKIVGDI